MNILQIASNMKKNGPALVVYDLAHGLAEQGHNVYIASAEGVRLCQAGRYLL